MSLKNRIKDLRKTKGLTQDDLARQVGLSKQQIWRLENGSQSLTEKTRDKIAAALDCDPLDLYGASYVGEKPSDFSASHGTSHAMLIAQIAKIFTEDSRPLDFAAMSHIADTLLPAMEKESFTDEGEKMAFARGLVAAYFTPTHPAS